METIINEENEIFREERQEATTEAFWTERLVDVTIESGKSKQDFNEESCSFIITVSEPSLNLKFNYTVTMVDKTYFVDIEEKSIFASKKTFWFDVRIKLLALVIIFGSAYILITTTNALTTLIILILMIISMIITYYNEQNNQIIDGLF